MSLNLGILASSKSAASAELLLDTYPGAAVAYSISRKLRSAYTGAAIRVLRVSDLVQLDIGFVNNQLDITSLQNFIGSGSGIVYTIYDQSGNGNNATNNVFAGASYIINSGTLITNNSKPALQFSSSRSNYKIATILPKTESTILCVNKRTSTSTIGFKFSSLSDSFPFWGSEIDSKLAAYSNPSNNRYAKITAINYDTLLSTKLERCYMGIGSNITGYINNTAIVFSQSFSFGTGGTGFQSIGNQSNCNFSELIYYSSNKISDNTGMGNNINTFYSIY